VAALSSTSVKASERWSQSLTLSYSNSLRLSTWL
jgi:hypothetical protein